MKNFIRYAVLSLSLVIMISCSKIPDHAKYIPKNAIGVFSVDMNQLSKKLIWNLLTGSELFDEMQKDIKNEESKKAMKDFSNIGLDPSTTIYFFYTGNMKNENHPCAVAGMKDASKFESFITRNYPELKIEDNKKYKSCFIEKSFLVAWNKEVALAVPVKDYSSMGIDTAGMDPAAVSIDLAKIESEQNFIKQCFEISKENAITNLSNFKSLQKDGHDFSLWINYEELYLQNKDLSSGELQAFIKPEYFKDAALATGFDFEKGVVDMEVDYYFSKELAAIYKKHTTDNIDADLIKDLPSKDICFIAAYNLKPQMIQDFLAHFKLDGLANLGLMAMGTSMESIVSTFKGDMVFAISDMKMKPPPADTTLPDYMYSNKTPDMNFTFAMNISDAANLEKLLGKGVKENYLVKNGNVYRLKGDDDAGTLMYDKSRMVYSNKEDMAKQFIDKKGNAKEGIPADAWKNIVNNPIAVYADIKKMMQAVPLESKEPEEMKLMEELRNMFTYAQVYGGKMKNNANHMEGNLYFTNKEENSMIQLLNLAMKAKKVSDKTKNANVPVTDTVKPVL